MSLSLDTIGDALWNRVSQSIGIFFIMFAITIGTGKLWDPKWNLGIKSQESLDFELIKKEIQSGNYD